MIPSVFRISGSYSFYFLICGDSLDYLKTLKDDHFDLGCTDIPYGMGITKHGFARTTEHKVKQANGKVSVIKRANKYRDESLHWDQELPTAEWFREFIRVTKHQIFYGIDKLSDALITELGLGYGRIKWDKGVAPKSTFKKFEYAYCSFIDWEEPIEFLWSGMFQGRSINEPMKAHGNKKLHEKRYHPTQKPIVMWELIFKFAKKHISFQSVLDPYCGVSSQCKALSNFSPYIQWVGIDREERFIDITLERFSNIKQQV